jgi:hypothetical protein
MRSQTFRGWNLSVLLPKYSRLALELQFRGSVWILQSTMTHCTSGRVTAVCLRCQKDADPKLAPDYSSAPVQTKTNSGYAQIGSIRRSYQTSLQSRGEPEYVRVDSREEGTGADGSGWWVEPEENCGKGCRSRHLRQRRRVRYPGDD